MSKSEIEKELLNKGTFVQIDYLTAFIKEDIPTDIRRFAMLKMTELYEKSMMFREVAKIYNNLALLVTPFSEKIKYHIKEAEALIKLGESREADYAMQKAMTQANTFEKNDIIFNIKQFYKKQAEVFEKEMRRNNAAKMYEKLLELSSTDTEKRAVRMKLMELYEKLGKFREYNALKDMNGN